MSYTEEYISSLGEYAPIVLSVLGVLGKMEKQKISLRTKAALSNLKSKGVTLGRPRSTDDKAEKVIALRNEGKSLGQIVEETKMPKSSVWRILQSDSQIKNIIAL